MKKGNVFWGVVLILVALLIVWTGLVWLIFR